MQNLLTANNINKTFKLGNQSIKVLQDVAIAIKHAEFVAIMGKSGSGKSTLISILAGLDLPDTGSVMLNNQDLVQLSEDELAIKRQTDISFVFQSFHLIPTLTVAENIGFPLKIARNFKQNIVNELLKKVELSHRANSFPHQLSGGEKQRTAIARALVTQPKILFADEPTGNLDEKNAQSVMRLLIDLQQEYQSTLVVVTHDPAIASLADRIIHIVDGRI
ncbi:ABC-type antimicrobial peptide transport system, ATPase component [hydrothermal vent metagenome]|uniref:ABC-type antimicrobial peptide transport system, ATPase component n=1 Tax=hydrothermal vent metagenome TaxID=652676 RepID=A0A3B0V989_9ZZZZ